MSGRLPNPKLVDTAAADLVCRLRGAGHEAFLVGGCVRDLLLGLAPGDFDVATSARPEEVQSLFPRTVPVGEKFGVILVLEKGGEYQVATFRAESGYADHRRPDHVTYCGPREDAIRRDFTINGLFYDPIEERVVDYVGGIADLQAGVLRTIGDPRERFQEDYLRLLRAVRFACRFGFRVDPATLTAVAELSGRASEIAAERIREELVKIFTGPDPARALDLLHRTGLLAVLLPEVAVMADVEQPLPFHPEGDVLVHTGFVVSFLTRSGGKAPSATLAMAALLHDIGKPPTFRRAEDRIRFDHHPEVGARMAEDLCRRLRFSNEERERITALVAEHLRFIEAPNMREAKLKRFLREPGFDEHLALHRADCLGSHGDLSIHRFCAERLEVYRRESEAEALRPRPLLTGHDLLSMGYPPGPVFREILGALEDAQLEGRLTSRREAMEFVQRGWSRPRAATPPAP